MANTHHCYTWNSGWEPLAIYRSKNDSLQMYIHYISCMFIFWELTKKKVWFLKLLNNILTAHNIIGIYDVIILYLLKYYYIIYSMHSIIVFYCYFKVCYETMVFFILYLNINTVPWSRKRIRQKKSTDTKYDDKINN